MWRPTGRAIIGAALATLVAVAAAGCTRDGEGAAAGGTGGTTGGGTGATGPVPDACALVAAEEIEAITRSHPGIGSTSGSAEVSQCLYESGLVLSVERASAYQAARTAAEAAGEVEVVADVGIEAFWDPDGRLVALGERYTVTVAMRRSNRAAREAAAQIASVMLESL